MGKNGPGSLVLKKHCQTNWLALIPDNFPCIQSRQRCGKKNLGAWLWGMEGDSSYFLHHQHKLKNMCMRPYGFGGWNLGSNHADQHLLKTWSVVLGMLEIMLDYKKGVLPCTAGSVSCESNRMHFVEVFYTKILAYCKTANSLLWNRLLTVLIVWNVDSGIGWTKFSNNKFVQKFSMCRNCLQTQISIFRQK